MHPPVPNLVETTKLLTMSEKLKKTAIWIKSAEKSW